MAAVHNFGAGDIVEIAPAEGGPSRLIAFTDDTVPEVDVAGGRLVLIPPEELEASEDDEDSDG